VGPGAFATGQVTAARNNGRPSTPASVIASIACAAPPPIRAARSRSTQLTVIAAVPRQISTRPYPSSVPRTSELLQASSSSASPAPNTFKLNLGRCMAMRKPTSAEGRELRVNQVLNLASIFAPDE
jgi:hypothetical protein